MVKYQVVVEWKDLTLIRGTRREPLTHKELNAFLDGLDYGVAHGKPDKITITPILEETKETATE